MHRLFAHAAVAAAFLSTAALAATLPAEVTFTDTGAVAQSLTGQPGDPAAGLKVATTRPEGNCIACHAAQGWAKFPEPGNVGPPLDGVGARYSAAELRGIVVNAKKHFPDTVMPAFYKVDGIIRPGDGYTAKAAKEPLQPILTPQQVEDVVALLETFKN